MIIKLSLIILSFFCFSIFFPALFSQELAGKDIMNGHRLKDYKNFEKKWKLVTVRYRKDNAEMRFTYANEKAYNSLLRGVIDYPDGAVFAKIGLKTEEDSSFPSSAVPRGARRYQFMVRNKKKYSATQGWSYALFDENGFTFPEEPKNQTMACVACHNAVPERGYVFSELMEHLTLKKKKLKVEAASFSSLFFKTIDTNQLPRQIFTLLPQDFKKIRILEGELTKNIFQGTLDEIRPALSREVERSKLPAVLFNQEGTKYSLVIPENIDVVCHEENKIGTFMKSICTTLNQNGEGNEKVLHFCFIH